MLITLAPLPVSHCTLTPNDVTAQNGSGSILGFDGFTSSHPCLFKSKGFNLFKILFCHVKTFICLYHNVYLLFSEEHFVPVSIWISGN